MTTGVPFFSVALVAYSAALFAYLVSLLFRRSRITPAGTGLLALGCVAQTVGLVLRGLHVGMLAVTNTYETLVFYSWVIVLAFLFVTLVIWRHTLPVASVGQVTAGISVAMIALASSPLFSSDPRPLVAVLRSHWLTLHVCCAILGEGFFAVAAASSGILLWFSQSKRMRRASQATLELLDSLSYKAIALGFPLFTLGGLFFGAIWAKHAWGRYWGWDPKETFTFVTWLVYVVYLHLRVGLGWRGRRVAWVAVLGFALALFTFAGVNYLLRGLHSYR